MDFSRNIQKYRLDQHLTQAQLAEQVFVTRQAVSRWENGDSVPDLEMVAKLARLFSVSTDELLGVDSNVCQSCGNIIESCEDRGTEEDGSRSPLFCSHCRKNGRYVHVESMEDFAARNTDRLVSFLRAIGHPAYPDIILNSYLDYLPHLQRWSKE